MIKITQEKIKRLMPEILIAIISSTAGILMTWWVFINDRTITFVIDAVAHLDFARLFTDSMTPGLSQIGFWPPLLHFLMAPFAMFDIFYRTGLAGAVVLVPLNVIATIVLYRITLNLTHSRLLSLTAALVYILNPFILFYAAVPMMEILSIDIIIFAAYFFLKWQNNNRLKDLIAFAFFVSLSVMARFENIFFIGLGGLLIIVELLRRKKSYSEIEAVSIIFGVVAVIGLGFIMVYGWVYGDNPFLMWTVSSGFTEIEQASKVVKTTSILSKGSFLWSLKYYLAASYYVIGKPLVLLSFISAIGVIVFSRKRYKDILALLFLLFPFIIMIFALYRGTPLYVLEFPPNYFFNLRYALIWMPFIAVAPMLFVSSLRERFFNTFRSKYISGFFIIMICGSLLFITSRNGIMAFQYDYLDYFSPKKQEREQGAIVTYLATQYDFGKIIISRFKGEYLIQKTPLPLRTYIQEGNYKYYKNALDTAWLYARWIIKDKDANRSGLFGDAKLVTIEEIWSKDKDLSRYYELVAQQGNFSLYRINESIVRDYVQEKNLNPSKVPSLNSSITNWNPDTIRQEMEMD